MVQAPEIKFAETHCEKLETTVSQVGIGSRRREFSTKRASERAHVRLRMQPRTRSAAGGMRERHDP